MNRYHELITEVVDEMRKEGFGNAEDLQVYASTRVYDSISKEYDLVVREERRIQTEPLGVGSPTKAAFGEDVPEFTAYGIIQLNDIPILQEPRLREGEIVVLDTEGFDARVLKHPVCVEKIRTDVSEERSNCDYCGKSEEITVTEQDKQFCSVNCLNEYYNP